MFDEKVDHFHAPEILLQILFTVWSEKIMQRWRGIGAGVQSPLKTLVLAG